MSTLQKLNTFTRLPIPAHLELAQSDTTNVESRQTVRLREAELDPKLYSTELGEFLPAPTPPNRENKKLIDLCVTAALEGLRLKKNQKISSQFKALQK